MAAMINLYFNGCCNFPSLAKLSIYLSRLQPSYLSVYQPSSKPPILVQPSSSPWFLPLQIFQPSSLSRHLSPLFLSFFCLVVRNSLLPLFFQPPLSELFPPLSSRSLSLVFLFFLSAPPVPVTLLFLDFSQPFQPPTFLSLSLSILPLRLMFSLAFIQAS